MSVLDLVNEANRMKLAGRTNLEIHGHIVRSLINYSGVGDGDHFEYSSSATGDAIKFDGHRYTLVKR